MKKFLILPVYYTVISIAFPYFASSFFSPAPKPADTDEAVETVTVLSHMNSESETMSLEDYLIGVVAAEMPASFEDEALKAQAVAARTYTYYKSDSGGHEEDVCTDPGHCQAYFTKSDMELNWGGDYEFYFDKIKEAVYSTRGEHLTYNEEPVMAVFHSMGGGKTENASDVWGNSLPYLISVESPGEEAASTYKTSVTVSFNEFKEKILALYPNAKINSFLDISQPILTEGGHVKSMVIGSVTVSGTTLRTLFNLRSTKFDLVFEEDNITFNVTGYGHGVGMSQYGANAMAKEGKDYREILSHYYQGTTLSE